MTTTEHREQITIKLASQQHEADATAVASTMSAVVALVSEAHQQLKQNETLLVKARPFAEGSLEIPLDLIIMAAGTLLATSPLIENILDVLKKYFEIKNLLRGESFTRKGDNTIIFKNNEINVGTITLNLLGPASRANQEMAKALKDIEKDETIKAIELVHGPESRPLAKVARSQFHYYSLALPESLRRDRDVRSRETLRIASIVFEGTAMWRFARMGSIVAARITDKDFVHRVQSRVVRFAAGDTLDVDLVIHQEFDFGVNEYVNRSYAIERVWKHEKQKSIRQQQMFPDEMN